MIENIAYDVVSGFTCPGQRTPSPPCVSPPQLLRPQLLTTKRAGIPHVRRSLVAKFTRSLAIRSVVRGEDHRIVCRRPQGPWASVEYPADVIVALH